MTNNDQSNQSATSPTNSEAVRSGDWLGDEKARRANNWEWWERRAAIWAHQERAEYLMGVAKGHRERAAGRGLLWERELKHALQIEAGARQHYQRIKDLRSESPKSPSDPSSTTGAAQ